MKIVVLVVILLLAGVQVPRAQQPPPDDPLSFRTGVELVMVDVTVVDRQGHPLRGLRADDFAVSVAGRPRRVVSAEFVDRTATLQVAPDPDRSRVSTNEGAPGGRIVIFVVDQNTLEPGAARRVATAASHLLARLTPADRSALVVLPLGPHVELTWAHHQVRESLERIGGLATMESGWEYGSLSEARDIAGHNLSALRVVAERECGAFGRPMGTAAGGGGGPGSPPPSDGGPGGGGGQEGGGEGGGTPAGGGVRGGGGGVSSGFLGGLDNSRVGQCVRTVQVQAEAAWRSAENAALTSVTSLRQALAVLARVGGDKHVVLVSGGWPMQERDQLSLVGMVASEAAAARATLYPFFVPASSVSASRRFISSSPVADEHVRAWPLETLAGMTGGASFRVQVGAEAAFDRLAQEMSGHYRIGVERGAGDQDGKARQLKVQVARGSVTVRAREIFDVPTYEDRNWSARLHNALAAPAPSTGLGLRLTSYVSADRDDSARVRLRLAGEASRLHPGDATFQFVVRDATGKEFVSEEQFLGRAAADRLPFSVDVPVSPGTYAVRFAVMDSAGRVGSVDHRADARREPLGSISGFGPLLVRVPRGGDLEPQVVLDGLDRGERLALQVDLSGAPDAFDGAEVVFEIASTADGPPLLELPATLSADPGRRAATAESLADLRLLPPGRYVARARVFANGDDMGALRRPFDIADPAHAAAGTTPAGGVPPERLAARVARVVPPFTVDRVLAPPVLHTFLERVSARADAAAPASRELLERARAGDRADAGLLAEVRSQSPALAAFLDGLSLLSRGQLDPAANAFRSALRAAPDFYPAMVYLGACYAAGGKDREAAAAWRTALIREADALPLHSLLADALLRQGRGENAYAVLDAARQRWPGDRALHRQQAVAAVASGNYVEGLDSVDELVDAGLADAPMLELALLVLYEAAADGQPVVSADFDRARMLRLADAYRAIDGPSMALVDRWLAALDEP